MKKNNKRIFISIIAVVVMTAVILLFTTIYASHLSNGDVVEAHNDEVFTLTSQQYYPGSGLTICIITDNENGTEYVVAKYGNGSNNVAITPRIK